MKEVGDVDDKVIYDGLISETLNEFRGISSAVGVKYIVSFPITAAVKNIKNIVLSSKSTN